MDRLRLKGEGGFTLIELLVVIAIIGILAAIAIPQFAAYRKRGYEAQVKSDLRNAATAEEAYFAGTQPSVYKPGALSSGVPTGYNQSADVTGMNAATTASGFVLTGTHGKCAGQNWTYDSASGTISGPAAGCP